MRSLRSLYYRALVRFSEFRVPRGVGDFQLVDRRVVTAMRAIGDSQPFMRLMTFECGGQATGVPYTWRAREKGFSKNRLSALYSQGMTGVVSFTTAPVRMALLAGFGLAFLAMLFAVVNLIVGLVLFQRVAPPGIMTLVVAIFFFGGVQLFFLGVIGEYILAIYNQVRERPVVFERERINFAPAEPGGGPPLASQPAKRLADAPDNSGRGEAGTRD
jgi:hypothetical protein